MENTGNGIYKAMANIIKEIGHISKEKQTTGFANYKYRGIDDVYNAINPLMGKFGVFVLPMAQERTSEERKTSKGSANYVIMRMTYRFCHEDGSYVECSTVGEAMDSGDKGTNKAMSIAMKYALFQIFCIPTEEMDDPDAVSEAFVDKDKAKSKPHGKRVNHAVMAMAGRLPVGVRMLRSIIQPAVMLSGYAVVIADLAVMGRNAPGTQGMWARHGKLESRQRQLHQAA